MHRAIITSSYHHSRVSYLHHDHAIAAAAGSTIGKFLERVRQDLLSQFPELQVRVCVCVFVGFLFRCVHSHRLLVRAFFGFLCVRSNSICSMRNASLFSMQRVSSDDLLYVKEDLILSHGLSFYDLIATKVRSRCSLIRLAHEISRFARCGPQHRTTPYIVAYVFCHSYLRCVGAGPW